MTVQADVVELIQDNLTKPDNSRRASYLVTGGLSVPEFWTTDPRTEISSEAFHTFVMYWVGKRTRGEAAPDTEEAENSQAVTSDVGDYGLTLVSTPREWMLSRWVDYNRGYVQACDAVVYWVADEGETTVELLEFKRARETAAAINHVSPRAPEEPPLSVLEHAVDELFLNARNEEFEQGMDSDFSVRLRELVENHGSTVMNEIAYLVRRSDTPPSVATEALSTLGELSDASSRPWREWILTQVLLDGRTARIRDAAALAFADLLGSDCVPVLREAARSEKCEELRALILQLCAEFG